MSKLPSRPISQLIIYVAVLLISVIMEDNNRRSFRNYQNLLGRLEDNGAEREILQVTKKKSKKVATEQYTKIN